jgi:hypothetical protein
MLIPEGKERDWPDAIEKTSNELAQIARHNGSYQGYQFILTGNPLAT